MKCPGPLYLGFIKSNPANDEEVHVWAPGFRGFGGGIAAFSREFAAALPWRRLLFGKVDELGEWEGDFLWGAGGWPTRLQAPIFAAGVCVSVWKNRPALVVSTHLNFGPVAEWLRGRWGVPYALVAHGVDVAQDLSERRKHALREADQVIAVSHWTRDRLVDLVGVPQRKISILPNTYDSERFYVKEVQERLKARYGIREGEKVILTVARLDSMEGYKGYDRVMQALRLIRSSCGSVRFLIAGNGEDRARLESMANALGVTDAVIFAGFVSDEELADHYRLADVFAMPSTGEGFGIVFLESMGCGTPVLAGNQDGSVDALDQGRLGLLIDPNSVEAIADGIISLLNKQGPDFWFKPEQLSNEVKKLYGRQAFQKRVAEIFGFAEPTNKAVTQADDPR